jgi:hypothetical protein
MHIMPFDLKYITENLSTVCKPSVPRVDCITFQYNSLSNYKFHNYRKFDARDGGFSEWADILE